MSNRFRFQPMGTQDQKKMTNHRQGNDEPDLPKNYLSRRNMGQCLKTLSTSWYKTRRRIVIKHQY